MNQLTQIAKESGTLFRKGFLETKQITYKGAVDLLTEYENKSGTKILVKPVIKPSLSVTT